MHAHSFNHHLSRCLSDLQCQKLNLVSLGQAGAPINAIAVHKNLTFTASGNTATSWRRGKEVMTYAGHEADIHLMLPFGEHMIAVDEDNVVNVFNQTSGMVISF
jgi:U3 small nucleolar RNA-associated protein 21